MNAASREDAHRTGPRPGATAAWSIAGILLLAALAVVIAVVVAGGDPVSAPTGVPAAATPTSTIEPTPGDPPAPLPGVAPGATPVDGSEVPPPDSSNGPSDGVPRMPPRAPLVTTPLPASGFARGELLPGFPAGVAGPMAIAEVIDSSLSADGATLQATLTARTDLPPDQVRAHYVALWADLGLAPSPSPDGETTSYLDPFSAVTLAFATGSGTGTVYTVYAVLRTA